MRMHDIRIGTSGWNYPHWKGLFYDENTPKSNWLAAYAQHFSTVEVNATFYHLPRPQTVDNWRDGTPEGFLWAVKASRYITHVKKLRNPRESLERFNEAVERFEHKLGPILFQLPPMLKFDAAVFDEFCAALKPGRRYALEVRHPDWIRLEALQSLKDHGMAFCIADTAGRFPYAEAVTADFIYVRLHGSRALYSSEYSEEELQNWAKKIKKWKRDTYVYFDNDFNAFAPRNALKLKEILKSTARTS